jgi:hypothetical protein
VVRAGGPTGDGQGMTPPFELHVAGPLPQGVVDGVGSRFGDVAMHPQSGSTVLTGTIPDQAALRALMHLVWDSGGSILSLTWTVTCDAPGQQAHAGCTKREGGGLSYAPD